MIDKTVSSAAAAIADIHDDATVMIGGFGVAGQPAELIDALIDHGARNLTIVNNNAGNGETGPALLRASGAQDHLFVSAPGGFPGLRRALPRRRHRAGTGAAGQSGRAHPGRRRRFRRHLHPTGYGTELAAGKETRRIDGRDYVLEYPIHADFALIKAWRGDRWGNLQYRKTARNFGPIMAAAARQTIAQIGQLLPLGEMDPETVVTPGIFVHKLVCVAGQPTQGGGHD